MAPNFDVAAVGGVTAVFRAVPVVSPVAFVADRAGRVPLHPVDIETADELLELIFEPIDHLGIPEAELRGRRERRVAADELLPVDTRHKITRNFTGFHALGVHVHRIHPDPELEAHPVRRVGDGLQAVRENVEIHLVATQTGGPVVHSGHRR